MDNVQDKEKIEETSNGFKKMMEMIYKIYKTKNLDKVYSYIVFDRPVSSFRGAVYITFEDKLDIVSIFKCDMNYFKELVKSYGGKIKRLFNEDKDYIVTFEEDTLEKLTRTEDSSFQRVHK